MTYLIENNWDNKNLSLCGEWRNDGENCHFETEEDALVFIEGHEDRNRLTVAKFELIED